MDAYYVTPVGPFASAVGAAYGTFTTRQHVGPDPATVIAPNQLHLGSKIELSAEGEYNTTVTPTLILGFYLGVATATPPTITLPIAEQAVFTTPSGAANLAWHMKWRGIVTALGTAGSMIGHGTIEYETSLTALTVAPIPTTLALRTVAIDTTIARAIGVCATFGTSNAANTVKVYNHSTLLLN